MSMPVARSQLLHAVTLLRPSRCCRGREPPVHRHAFYAVPMRNTAPMSNCYCGPPWNHLACETPHAANTSEQHDMNELCERQARQQGGAATETADCASQRHLGAKITHAPCALKTAESNSSLLLLMGTTMHLFSIRHFVCSLTKSSCAL